MTTIEEKITYLVKISMAKTLTNKQCEQIFDQTTQLQQWIKEKIL